MKNILSPTDFSPCSKAAVNVAFQLAQRFGAKLHLVTSIGSAGFWPERTEAIKDEAGQAEQLLAEMKHGLNGVEVGMAHFRQKLSDGMADYVHQHGIDLVVMGSHGASGKNEIIVGSNTQKVVRQLHCPVLVVKHPIEQVSFQKIVYASSFEREELSAFLYFKELVKHFMPEIHLVSVHATPFGPPPTKRREAMRPFKEACKPFACKTHVYRDLSIDEGIRSFSEEIGADLIAISNYERHPLKRMLIGSNVEALVNHSQLPVLTIDFRGEE